MEDLSQYAYCPPGWTRGAAIRYAKTEDAIAAKVCAIIYPHHKTPPGAMERLPINTITAHDGWKTWWFSGPVIDPRINYPVTPEEYLRVNDSAAGQKVFPDDPVFAKLLQEFILGRQTASLRLSRKGTWFDQPKPPELAPAPPVWAPAKPPVNPFNQPPKNPFK